MARWSSLGYQILVLALLPFALLRLFWRNRIYPAAQSRWAERLGIYKAEQLVNNTVWLHAVSVGESNAAEPLIRRLLAEFPDHQILVTTTTATGAATIEERYKGLVRHVFFPFDLPFAIRRFLKWSRPVIAILMETELWPNMLEECEKRHIAVLLVNGRLSERTLRRYQRFPGLSQKMMTQLSYLAVQSSADAERFIALGANPDTVITTGSMKFDRDLTPSVFERGEAIRRRLGINRLIIMAGSTRDGEESLLAESYLRLREEIHNLLLVIAPRHPERFEAVYELLISRGLRTVRHSEPQILAADTAVYLLDTMGELANFYAAADIAFVGGSLAPFGGHNTLEPAGLGVPIIVGPHTYNFADINSKLEYAGALIVVRDQNELVEATKSLIGDSNKRDGMGLAARKVYRENRGALDSVMSLVVEKLPALKS